MCATTDGVQIFRRWKIRKCARQYCDKRCTLIKTRNKDDKMCSSVRVTPDKYDLNEDCSVSKAIGTSCCATVGIKTCSPSEGMSTYPVALSWAISTMQLEVVSVPCVAV